MLIKVSKIILRHWKPLLALNAFIAVGALFSTTLVEEEWGAQANLILPNTTSNLNASLGTLGDLSGGEGLVFSQQVDSREILASILMSDDTVYRVWEKDPEKETFSGLESYKSLFEVTTDDTSTIIGVTSQGTTQELALERLDALIQSFEQRLNDLRQEDALKRSGFIMREVDEAAFSLEQSQQQLAALQQKTNLVDVDSQTEQMIQSLRQLRSLQGQILAEFEASEARLLMLSERLGQSPEEAINALRLNENDHYRAVQQRLANVEVSLAEVGSIYAEAHPQVRTLILERDDLLSQLSQYGNQVTSIGESGGSAIGDSTANLIEQLVLAESETRALQQQAAQLQLQIEPLEESLQKIPSARAQILGLERQANINEGVYNGLVAQLQAIRINSFATYPSVQLLDLPSLITRPIGPGRRPILVGAILASLFGSAAIISFLGNNKSLLTGNDLQDVNLPILGRIPHIPGSLGDINLSSYDQTSFQRLATLISQKTLKKNRLLIASSSAQEGKTTVTLGLAVSLSSLGFRVLIVDGDTNQSMLSHKLGLFDVLSHSHCLNPVTVKQDLDLLVLANQPKVSEFILKGEFEELLNTLQSQQNYDYVLIDTNSIGLSNDAFLMARSVPDVLFVARLGLSEHRPFVDGLEQIHQQSFTNLHGLVLNDSENDLDQVSFTKFRVSSEHL